MSTFAADVAAWALNVEGAIEVIFREAAQELAREMDLLLEQTVYDQPISSSGYQRTGFLRASLVASSSVMPQLVRENPGTPVPPDLSDVILVINGAEIGGRPVRAPMGDHGGAALGNHCGSGIGPGEVSAGAVT